MSAATVPAFDDAKLNAFVGKMVGDVGATLTGALVIIGDRLGLYRALAEHGPLTSAELAEKTGTHERYVREWLANQAASGYLEYDPSTERFTLPPEHRPVLSDENSPVLLAGLYQIAQTLFSYVLQVSTGLDAQLSELCRRYFPYPEELFDGQRLKEG